MGQWLAFVAMLASSAGRPVLPAKPRTNVSLPSAQATVSMYVSPSSISFTATDPDTGIVAGNTASTVFWFYSGINKKTWSMSLQAGATTFSGCSTVPVSAVTATCSTIQVGGGSQPCGSAVTLSTAPQVIASGTEAAGFASYQVNITFTLADSWKYVAKMSPSCSLTLTYNGSFN